jgi:hypothetical protein
MARPLRLIALLALVIASFARLPAEAAATSPGHAMMMDAGHCDVPAPSPDEPAKMGVDCMIACAALVSPACAVLPAVAPGPASHEAAPPARITGIHSSADPPPPRLP